MHLKIFLYGYYGAKNFGDELLLYKIITDLKSVLEKDILFYIWTIDESFTKQFLKRYIPDIQLVCINRFDIKQTVSGIKESDIVILGGGGIVQEYHGIEIENLFRNFGYHIPSYAVPLLVAKIFGKKSFLWSVGHGPVGSFEAVAFSRWFYSLADTITTRDKQTYDQITFLIKDKAKVQLDIDPILDPNFDLNGFTAHKDKKNGKNIGLLIRSWFNTQEIVDTFCEALAEFKQINPDYTINLIPADPTDADVLNQIKQRSGIDDINLLNPNNPFEVIEHISLQDFIVSMRLHTTIVAYKLGIPTLALSYDEKTDSFIKQANLEFVDIYNLSKNIVLDKMINLISQKKQQPTEIKLSYSTPKIFKEFVENYKENKSIQQTTPIPQVDDKLLKAIIKSRQLLYQTVDSLQQQNTQLQQTVDSLQQQNTQLQQTVDSLQQTVNNLQRHNTQLQQTVDSMQQQNTQLQQTVDSLQQQNTQLQQTVDSLQQQNIELLNSINQLNQEILYYKNSLDLIYSSDFWKIASRYYKLRDGNIILRSIHTFLKNIKHIFSQKKVEQQTKTEEAIQQTQPINQKQPECSKYEVFNTFENSNKVVVILSGIKFEEVLNQRPLNLAKELSKAGYTVMFVVFQWSKDQEIENSFCEVYKNVYQIPLYEFIEFLDNSQPNFNSMGKKKVVITFPHPIFSGIYSKLRQKGFMVIYDIMDDWKAFYQVGQASWYDEKTEEKFILESDIVIAVNDFVRDKFIHLRSDIQTVPNGYSIDVVGEDKKFIGASKLDGQTVRIGYVGWLTDGLFNWEFVLKLASLRENIVIELIGYGLPDRLKDNLPKNIVYIGKVHPKELYKYFAKWNAVMIPFIDHHISKGADPIKVYQYIYYGLPILCTGMEHLSSYPLVFNVKSLEDASNFLNLVSTKSSIRNIRQSQAKKIEQFLQESLWSNRFKVILQDSKKSLWEN